MLDIHSPDDSSLDPTEAILLLGGFDGDSKLWLSSAQSYFPSSNVVKAHSSMSCIRSNASVAKWDGKIYVFGGDDAGNGWSNTGRSSRFFLFFLKMCLLFNALEPVYDTCEPFFNKLPKEL